MLIGMSDYFLTNQNANQRLGRSESRVGQIYPDCSALFLDRTDSSSPENKFIQNAVVTQEYVGHGVLRFARLAKEGVQHRLGKVV